MRKHIHSLTVLFLLLSSIFAGVGFLYYAIEHIWLFTLMVFCLVCGFITEKGGDDE